MSRKVTFAALAVGLTVSTAQLHSMQTSTGEHPLEERGGFSGFDWKGHAFTEFNWSRVDFTWQQTFSGRDWRRTGYDWGRTLADYNWTSLPFNNTPF